jgi:hypothetical protein
MEREATPRRPRDRRPERNRLTSPLLALALALVAIGLVGAIILIPGMLPQGVTPTSTPSPSPIAIGSAAPTASPSGSVLPSFVRPTATPLPTFIAYVVKAGDSLNTIAHRYNTTGRSIAWWNRGTYPSLDPEAGPNYSPGHIELGWVLVLIPGVTVDDANPPTPSPGPPTPAATESPAPTAS